MSPTLMCIGTALGAPTPNKPELFGRICSLKRGARFHLVRRRPEGISSWPEGVQMLSLSLSGMGGHWQDIDHFADLFKFSSR